MTPTNTTHVYEFLSHHPTGVLSTASPTGEPWGSTIVFACDEDFTFYFMTRANTQKYKNIAANPHIALTVTDQATQTTVQAAGTVELVSTDEMMDVVFQKLDKIKPAGTQHWVAPVYKIHEGDYMVLSFKPTSLQYADFSQSPDNADTNFIEQII